MKIRVFVLIVLGAVVGTTIVRGIVAVVRRRVITVGRVVVAVGVPAVGVPAVGLISANMVVTIGSGTVV
jgi:hypothetical protein